MCAFKMKMPQMPKLAVLPQPEKTAEATEVGAARRAEDQELFGGTPQLRSDRSGANASGGAGGTGLRMM